MAISYLDKTGLSYFWGKVKALAGGKVDKENGKGLSTNDYTNEEKQKLGGIASGAEVNVQSDWSQSDNTADDFIKNKPQSMKNPAALTFGSKTYDGSAAKEIVADDLNAAQKNGTYPLLTAGNLTGPTVQSDAEIVFRKTGGSLSVQGGDEGEAVIQKVKGKTVVWNQLVPTNIITTQVISGVVTYTNNEDGSITINGTNNTSSPIYPVSGGVPAVVGHKYYAFIKNGESDDNFYMQVNDGNAQYYGNALIITCSQGVFNYYPTVKAGGSVTNRKIWITTFDLTLMFGAGNEPSTVAEFEAMFPLPYYDYQPGKLINNGRRVNYDLNWNQLVSSSASSVTVTSGHIYISYIGGTKSRATSDGTAISVTGGTDCIFDLTLMFGSGNEPQTVEEFEELFPEDYYPYNAGEQQTFHFPQFETKVETVGFNLWDESQRVNGYYISNTTGNEIANSDYSHTGYVPVLPSTTYYLMGITSGQWGAYYDANKKFISGYTFASPNTFTTPANAAYVRISMLTTDVSSNICINLSDTSRNGQYEPYWKNTLPVPITTMTGKKDGVGESVVIFPDGLKSAGSVHDEITEFEAIKRVGVVDLGSLDWSYSSSYGFYSTGIQPYVKAGDVTSRYNLICDSFISVPYNALTTSNNGITINDSKAICCSSQLTDSSAFKASVSGVLLYYELATPEHYTLDEPLALAYKVDGLGTEKRLPEDTPAYPLAPFRAEIEYALNAIGTLQRLDDNYVNRDKVAQDLGNDPDKVLSQQATTHALEQLAQRFVLHSAATDLSYYDVFGHGIILRETANTYVVPRKGDMWYKIPLVYGNGIHKGKENPAAYTRLGSTYTADFVNHLGEHITSPFIEENAGCHAASAGLLWQTSSAFIDEVAIEDGVDCRYLRFHVNSPAAVGSDAVLYVKDANNDIIWSWMIWAPASLLSVDRVTNYTGVHYDFLSENLGALVDNTSYRINPLYQWGRKDPMCPPAAYNSGSNLTLYDISGNTYSGFGNYGADADSDAGGTTRSVANSIKMPEKFFIEYDTTSYNWNNLTWFNNFWNAAITGSGDLADNQATAIKTIYDPCPVGFMLPAGRAWTGFTTTGTNSSTASEFNVIGSFSAGWNFKKDAQDTVGTYYPASGYRNRASGGLDGVGGNGYHWSFAPASQAFARDLDFYSGSVYPLDDNRRAYGFSVRPSREY